MKRTLVLFAVLLIALGAFAQNVPEVNNHTHHFPVQGWARPGGGGSQNLAYHTGAPVIISAKVVEIFWGDFSLAESGYTTAMQNFRNNFGNTGEYNVITQYYQNVGSGNQYIQSGKTLPGFTLKGSQPDWFDTTNALPSDKSVTDALVQAEVNRYIAAYGYDASTIYEVFIPPGYYSNDGTGTSCGGPSLGYCAYHGNFSSSGRDVKYSIQPYANCSGCSSFNDPIWDEEHFICHETREAVTDPDLNAWYDRRGNEADDKCAWSPTPFLDGGYGYQYEWSNVNSGCITTR